MGSYTCSYDITCDYEKRLRDTEKSLAAIRKKASVWRRDAERYYREVRNLTETNRELLEALKAAEFGGAKTPMGSRSCPVCHELVMVATGKGNHEEKPHARDCILNKAIKKSMKEEGNPS